MSEFAPTSGMPSIEQILRIGCSYFRVDERRIRSPERCRAVARPRQMMMAAAREMTNRSLPDIGKHFGGRDHTTALHAVRRVAQLRADDPMLDEQYRSFLLSVRAIAIGANGGREAPNTFAGKLAMLSSITVFCILLGRRPGMRTIIGQWSVMREKENARIADLLFEQARLALGRYEVMEAHFNALPQGDSATHASPNSPGSQQRLFAPEPARG